MLLDVNDSVLIVIDVQDDFLVKLPAEERGPLVGKIVWLIELAQWCGVPLVVTAEELPAQPVAAAVVGALPPGAPIFNKLVFGLADQPDIMAAVAQSGRRTAVLVGLETDVCVAHSALGLLALGYRVAVVADATGSPAPGHAFGLRRAEQAGAVVLTMKGLLYEWLRTVPEVDRLHRERPHMRAEAGVVL